MRKLLSVLTILLIVLAIVVGCRERSANASDGVPYSMGVSTVPLPDGRKVICVTFWQESISCDWPGAK